MKHINIQDEHVSILRASQYFDANWYLKTYPDVAMIGLTAEQHYLWLGVRLKRNPSQHFDTEFYNEQNPDVVAAGINPLIHFILRGQAEGRPPAPIILPTIDRDAGELAKPVTTRNTVILISGEALDRAGFFYRVQRLSVAFEALGYKAIVLAVADANRNLPAIEEAAFVFIWRALHKDITNILKTAKNANTPTIYDIDDLMVRPDLATAQYIDAIRFNKADPQKVSEHYSQIVDAMAAADFCTASTSELAWQMRRSPRRRPTFVIPNGYDREVYMKSRQASRSRPKDGLIRIGYASGSRTHQADFRQCASAVATALKEYPNARLVLFRRNELVTLDLEEFPEFHGLEDRVEWRPFVELRNLPLEVGRFDINLAPLEAGNPFCESKSELKIFEAALCETPTIASPTGPMSRAMIDGETGFLATTDDQWLSALRALLSDANFRKEMGGKSHRFALWHWGPTRRAEVLRSVLDQVEGGRRGTRSAHYSASEKPVLSVPLRPFETIANYDKGMPSQATVIVPLFNYETYIEEALESVAAQTMRDLELIVVDDASTDNSLPKVRDWAALNHDRFNRLVIVKHVNNEGLGASRNTAFNLADTLYVLPLDADNRIRPRCCSVLFEAARKEAATFAYPVIQQFGDGNSKMGGVPYRPANLIPGNYIDAMAMVSKEAWACVGGYSEKRRGWQDYEFWCRLADRGLFGAQVDEVLADYRVHSGSMLRTATDKGKNKAELVSDLEETYPWLSLRDERDGHRVAVLNIIAEQLEQSDE